MHTYKYKNHPNTTRVQTPPPMVRLSTRSFLARLLHRDASCKANATVLAHRARLLAARHFYCRRFHPLLAAENDNDNDAATSSCAFCGTAPASTAILRCAPCAFAVCRPCAVAAAAHSVAPSLPFHHHLHALGLRRRFLADPYPFRRRAPPADAPHIHALFHRFFATSVHRDALLAQASPHAAAARRRALLRLRATPVRL